MNLLTDILAIYILASSLILLFLTTVGLWLWFSNERKYNLLTHHLLSSGEHAEQAGISVIATGIESLEEIKELLSLDYAHYEVIVICDFGTMAAPADLIHHYAMTEVDRIPPGELLYTIPETMYRSRQRRYRRLLVVNKRHTTVSDDFNCGVALANHNYVICTGHWDKLTSDALQRLTIPLHEHPFDTVYAVGGLEQPHPHPSFFGMLQTFTSMITLGCGAGSLIGMGYYPGIAVLFERESIVEAGGFHNDFHPVPELLARVRRLPTNRQRHELFIPTIVMEENETEASPCSCLLSRIPGGRIRIVSGSIFLLVLLLLLVLLTIAISTKQMASTQTLIASLLTIYLTSVTIAILSFIAAREMFLTKNSISPHPHSKTKIITSLLFYPFLLLRCLIWPPNFIKS